MFHQIKNEFSPHFQRKTIKKSKETSKSYKILAQKDFTIMQLSYLKSPYPLKEELERLAFDLSHSVDKIRNWFKHQRNKKVKAGKMKYIKKYVFSKEEKSLLLEQYSKTQNPTLEIYEQLAMKLKCQVKNVKHWFGYRRKLSLKRSKCRFLNDGFQNIKKEDEKHSNEILGEKKPVNLNFEKKEENINQNNSSTQTKNAVFTTNLYQPAKNRIVFLAVPIIPSVFHNNFILLNKISSASAQLMKNQEYFMHLNSYLAMRSQR